jgi:hypothetical protein
VTAALWVASAIMAAAGLYGLVLALRG